MKDRLTPIAVVTVVLLLCGYVGSYYALVQVGPVWPNSFAYYRIGGKTAKSFYYPIHWIDRKVRPATWDNRL